GPAGLTAAISAKLLGLNPVVYEKSQELPQIGAGFLIHSNGLRVLDRLGVLAQVLPSIKLTQRMQTETIGGKVITDFNYACMSIPHNHGAVVLREDLRKALFESAQSLGIHIQFGHDCSRIASNRRSVRLSFTNGFEADHASVLACDGVNSRIRQTLQLPATI